MPKTHTDIITLIEQSASLSSEDKKRLRAVLDTLDEKELDLMRLFLQEQEKLYSKTLFEILREHLEKKPDKELMEKLNRLFTKSKKALQKGKEKDEKEIEEEELQSLTKKIEDAS